MLRTEPTMRDFQTELSRAAGILVISLRPEFH